MASQPLLLGVRSRTRCAPAQSLDFQARLGRPPAGDPSGPAPGVLLLTRAADREADELSLRLAVRGVPMLRLDSDRSAGLDLTWDITDSVVETPDGRFAPTAIWLRNFSGASVRSHGGGGVDGLDGYVREQWVAWSRMLLGVERPLVVNGAAGPSAPDRVTQLAAARRVGLRVPATVVTSRPGTAAERIPGDGDLVVKSLGEHFVETSPGCLRALFARRLSRAELAAERGVEPAPVLVQEFLPSEGELRVYSVGGELIGFRLRPHRPDSPFGDALFGDVEERTVTPAALPDGLSRPLELLTRHWGLDVAAFDLLDTPDGPVFLGVTVACDWLSVERRAGSTEVTDAVAGLLEKAFHAGAR
ncbi:MAG TPA: hypothetical protein VNP03_12050 [Pseudonocardia sp.]|nr:hypothetical protein [Pseudonocardia sp.]